MKLTLKQQRFADEYIISGNAYGVVYLITNNINGKQYVGVITRTIEQRFLEHVKADSVIGRAIRKHGAENFSVKELAEVDDKETLMKLEMYYIQVLNTYEKGYNSTLGGEGVKMPTYVNVNLNDKQKKFVTLARKSLSVPVDVNNDNQMVSTILISLMEIFLTTRLDLYKKKTARLLLRLQPELLSEVLRQGVIEFRDLCHWGGVGG